MQSQFHEKTQCWIKRGNSLTVFWIGQFREPHIEKDIDELVYAHWENRLEKDPVTLPGEEELVELRDIRYVDE